MPDNSVTNPAADPTTGSATDPAVDPAVDHPAAAHLQQRLVRWGYRVRPASPGRPYVALTKELAERVPGALTSIDVILRPEEGDSVVVYEYVGRELQHNHTRFNRVTHGNLDLIEWFIRGLEEQERF